MGSAGCEVGAARAFPFAFAAIVVIVGVFVEEVGGGSVGTGVFLSVHHLELLLLFGG